MRDRGAGERRHGVRGGKGGKRDGGDEGRESLVEGGVGEGGGRGEGRTGGEGGRAEGRTGGGKEALRKRKACTWLKVRPWQLWVLHCAWRQSEVAQR